jgi:hypothetical protein
MYKKVNDQFVLTEEAARKEFAIPAVIKVKAQDIEDIIVNSFEACSTYWLGVNNSDWDEKPKGMPVSQYATQLILEGKTVKLYDIEDEDEKWDLDIDKLREGLRFYFNNGRNLEDALDDSDSVVQYALFGEIVYS